MMTAWRQMVGLQTARRCWYPYCLEEAEVDGWCPDCLEVEVDGWFPDCLEEVEVRGWCPDCLEVEVDD
jgi:hypothetical protein